MEDKQSSTESKLPSLADLEFPSCPEGTQPHSPKFIDPRIIA
jgi:hypothetical protein